MTSLGEIHQFILFLMWKLTPLSLLAIEIMILELTAENETQTAFEIQSYFNSTQSKNQIACFDIL